MPTSNPRSPAYHTAKATDLLARAEEQEAKMVGGQAGIMAGDHGRDALIHRLVARASAHAQLAAAMNLGRAR